MRRDNNHNMRTIVVIPLAIQIYDGVGKKTFYTFLTGVIEWRPRSGFSGTDGICAKRFGQIAMVTDDWSGITL